MEVIPPPEVWRTIPGSNGLYSVSNYGRVRSEPLPNRMPGRQRGRILSPSKNRKGYLRFRICLPGHNPKGMTVHRAVALAFLGEPDGRQVNHKNAIKTNNRLENLEYVTCRENIRHCWDRGLHGTDHCKGEANNNAKLTCDAVVAIRAEYPSQSLSQLASQYGVTKQAVWHVVKRKTWVHI